VGRKEQPGSVQEGCFFPCNIINDPNFASCDTALRLRTGESMHLLCFWPSPTSRARRERKRGRRECGGGSERIARFCAGGLLFPVYDDPIFASCDTAPSPHGRINAPTLLLAFAHIQGEAGTPTGGVGSAMVGRKEQPGSVQEGCFFPCNIINDPNFASCDTAPRLRTDESMHLVCFWPSPTSRARRERQRGASGVDGGSEGTARFCAGGVLFSL
jgi:hypothetical protein